jgi:hypothetical protein
VQICRKKGRKLIGIRTLGTNPIQDFIRYYFGIQTRLYRVVLDHTYETWRRNWKNWKKKKGEREQSRVAKSNQIKSNVSNRDGTESKRGGIANAMHENRHRVTLMQPLPTPTPLDGRTNVCSNFR